MDRSGKIGAATIFLFALPFAGCGLFALLMAIRQLSTGEVTGPVWLPLVGLVCSSAPWGSG